MSKDSTLEAEKPKGTRVPLDMNDLEMVFGTPTAPKRPTPDVHTIANEHRTEHSANQNNNKLEDVEVLSPTYPKLPLLEPDKGKPQPPLAGPEIDDLDDQPKDTNVEGFHGIDDGLLEPVLPGNKTPEIVGDGDKEHKETDEPVDTNEEGVGTDDGKWLWPHDETDYPYDGVHGFSTRVGIDERPISPIPGVIPDVNTYQQKKNLAQGMMDLALLSANANQLRYVIESSSSGHDYFYSSIVFIALSIVLQVAVGIGLILNSRYDVKDEKDICKADKINNMTVLGVFLITIVNVFITSFSVAPTSTGIPAQAVQQTG